MEKKNEKGLCPKEELPNLYIPQVTLEELIKERNLDVNPEEIFKEQIPTAPNYYNEEDFLVDISKKINSTKDYIVGRAWTRIFLYFSTNSRFEYMTIKEMLNYVSSIANKKK